MPAQGGSDLTMLLLFGGFLAAIALFVYVFYQPRAIAGGPTKTRLSYLEERKEAVYENLRDLSFEHKAGKLSDADYEQQRDVLEDEAAGILAEMSQIENPGVSRTAAGKNKELA